MCVMHWARYFAYVSLKQNPLLIQTHHVSILFLSFYNSVLLLRIRFTLPKSDFSPPKPISLFMFTLC